MSLVAVAKLLLLLGNAWLLGVALLRTLAVRRWSRLLTIALWCIGGQVGLYLYAWHVEPNWVQVRRVVIEDAALARACGNLRIVQLSDLHVDEVGVRERRLPGQVNRLRPDLVVITGDFISSLVGVRGAGDLVAQIRAPLGVWGILGNTDHIFIDGSSLSVELRKAGAEMLNNGARYVRTEQGGFYLVGVDDPVLGYDRLEAAWAGVEPGAPAILLAHGPDIVNEPLAQRARLVLAGHTHGGQLGIPWIRQFSDYAERTPYMAGRFRVGQTQLYVNRGIGMKTRMFRFLCRPEITVITFRSPRGQNGR